MKKTVKIWLGVIVAVLIVGVTGWYLSRHVIPVLQPAGEISAKERNLIIFCAALSMVVVVPVFGLLGYIAWKYREDNHRAAYEPDQDGNAVAETIWWLVPTVLLVIISTVTWRSSYALDPFKLLGAKPLHIQVVALDWKWLFIYPDQHVASVNEAAIPEGTPVDFTITSDAVMTSFWAPQLAGQMYAMPGMSTQLNLRADKTGDFRGVAANISGEGFAGMSFTLKSMSSGDYQNWLKMAKRSRTNLTAQSYASLARPSENNKPTYYASVTPNLYDTIVMKYMMPIGDKTNTAGVSL